jgi:hypothetical protein
MNKEFIRNNDINYYNDKLKLIKYKNFNYKNYLNKEEGYEMDNEIPINLKKLAYIEIMLNRSNISIRTPIMLCLFGFNINNREICLQFTNYKTDKTMNNFFNFIQNIEYINMMNIGLDEGDSNLYINQIRNDRDNKYDPYLCVKIPFRYNKYEIESKNKDGNNFSIMNLYKFCRVECDIYIDKIWKFNDKYICKWKLQRLLLR